VEGGEVESLNEEAFVITLGIVWGCRYKGNCTRAVWWWGGVWFGLIYSLVVTVNFNVGCARLGLLVSDKNSTPCYYYHTRDSRDRHGLQ